MNIAPRAQLKSQARELLRTAQVSPWTFTALYCGITLLLDLLDYFVTAPEILGIFTSIFTTLASWVLAAGFALYCMGIRRQERMEYVTLFDGFAFTGKIILLNILTSLLTGLWAMLFLFPGLIAYYRYRFALYDLYEHPEMNILSALAMSQRQTRGFKLALFKLDLSYAGWILLALLPGLLFDVHSLIAVGMDPYTYLTTATPLWQSLVSAAWSALIALIYLPRYQCVLLDHFDAAKASASTPASFHQENGPDGLGGF